MFSEGMREEIERIKQEYYCGTQHALQIYQKVSRARKFADLVNERLEKLDASVLHLTWQLAESVRVNLLVQDNAESLEEMMDEKGYLPQENWRKTQEEQDDDAEEKTSAGASGRRRRMLDLQFGSEPWVVDLVAKHYQDLVDAGGLDYEEVCGAAKRMNEISFTGFHNDELVSLDVVADDQRRDVPIYMAGKGCDSIYVRMKEEGTLGVAALQQTFLLAFAGIARAKSVDDLRDFFRRKYREGQTEDLSQTGEEDLDLVPLLEEHNRLMCEAADYGLGLLRRTNLAGWLRKYLGA